MAFLTPSSDEEDSQGAPDNLDIGCHAVLFHGLTLTESIDVTDGITLLPFEQFRPFMDNRLVAELAPPGGGFYDWRSMGAAIRPFRWRPTFYQQGCERHSELYDPRPFFLEAQAFLELLGVAHATPVLCLAALASWIKRSAGRLLGGLGYRGAVYRAGAAASLRRLPMRARSWRRSGSPKRRKRSTTEPATGTARWRRSSVGLPRALARDGRFAVEDRILDVAIALERMYELDRGEISYTLRSRAAWFSRRGRREQGSGDASRQGVLRHAIGDRSQQEEKADGGETTGQPLTRDSTSSGGRCSGFCRTGPPSEWERLVIAGR